jgi:hypothetical protein
MKQLLTRTALMLLLCLFAATTAWAEHENDYLVLHWDGSQVNKTWTAIPTGDGVVYISSFAAGSSIVMGHSTSGETYVVADADATIDRSVWLHGTVHLILKNGVRSVQERSLCEEGW